MLLTGNGAATTIILPGGRPIRSGGNDHEKLGSSPRAQVVFAQGKSVSLVPRREALLHPQPELALLDPPAPARMLGELQAPGGHRPVDRGAGQAGPLAHVSDGQPAGLGPVRFTPRLIHRAIFPL